MEAIGVLTFAVRLPSPIFAGLVIYQLGRDLSNPRVAIIAALILYASPYIIAG